MLNYPKQSQKKSFIAFICLVFMFWAPHIGLDYVFEVENGRKIQLPYGQYFFFFSSFLAGLYLIYSMRVHNLLAIFSRKTLWIGAAFFLLGIVLSSPSAWGWRLFAIIGTISLLSVVGANFVLHSRAKTQFFALMFLVMPFSVPVFGSILLEFFGPMDIGFLLANTKHVEYSPFRWRFMNMSANGFGFDAALVSIFLTIGICYAKNITFRLVAIMLLCASIYALIMSGTRAAFIFYIAALIAFLILRYSQKALFFLVAGLVCGAVFTYLFDGVETLAAFLRLEGNLNQISSTRWVGIVGMWELFAASPFAGLGFGAADHKFPISPSNIFYFGVLAEIGLFGFLGALIILAYPAKYVLSCFFNPSGIHDAPFLFAFSASVLAGFVPYLMFEFDVLRVSVNNQLFFFCWGVLVFHSINADTNSNHKNATQV